MLLLRSKNIKKINHLNQYSKEKNHKSVEEKFKKSINFSNQRQKLIQMKREISKKLAMKKSNIINKFEVMFKKNVISVKILIYKG